MIKLSHPEWSNNVGDLGQAALREEQLEALGRIDLLLVPVGAGPTIGAAQAREIVDQVQARFVVPHHCSTTSPRGSSTCTEPRRRPSTSAISRAPTGRCSWSRLRPKGCSGARRALNRR
ncbi:MAG: hypothetical protein E6G41_10800 [Actinobacteria bacterium]|nr:MAG: hypothetical protein E6G41_10800 [Actinomycetota bacterium]